MNKKNFMKISGSIMLASMVLVGCSSGNKGEPVDNTSNVSASPTKTPAVAVADFVSEYYQSWLTPKDSGAYQGIQDDISEVLEKEDDISAFSNSKINPIDGISSLSKNGQRKIADIAEKNNVNAKFFDFSKMSDAERAVLNIMVVSLNSIVGSDPSAAKDVSVSLDSTSVTISEDALTASIPASALTIKIDGNTVPHSSAAINSGNDLSLVNIDGNWKIDGKSFLDKMFENSNLDRTDDGNGESNKD